MYNINPITGQIINKSYKKIFCSCEWCGKNIEENSQYYIFSRKLLIEKLPILQLLSQKKLPESFKNNSNDMYFCIECGEYLENLENKEIYYSKHLNLESIQIIEKLISWALDPPSPPNHTCGHPDSPCDYNCMLWARFQEDMLEAKKFLENIKK